MNRRFMVLITLAAACGKKEGDGAENAKPDKPATAIDVAGINALVPAPLRHELVFEQREVGTDHSGGGDGLKVRFTVALPKSWERKPYAVVDDFAALGPPASSKLDGSIQFSPEERMQERWDLPRAGQQGVGRGSWTEEVSTYRRDGMRFERDEVRPNDTTWRSCGSDSARYVVYAWWQDGGKRYRICWTKLSSDVGAAALAFEKSCRAVAVAGESDALNPAAALLRVPVENGLRFKTGRGGTPMQWRAKPGRAAVSGSRCGSTRRRSCPAGR